MVAEPNPAQPDVWIDTDADGQIVGWYNNGAADLLGYKYPVGRFLPMFIKGDRPGVAQFDFALGGNVVEVEAVMFPRGRRKVPVRYRIQLSPRSADRRQLLRWTFERLRR